ncbi:DUF481 domain-containing protein [Marinomonas arenicola]|uniref:DUF481 domain-containing protein n=1 Tax=Marinomonas arenicola TaxID=569601 RepID=A0ABU9G1T9_9GAMM
MILKYSLAILVMLATQMAFAAGKAIDKLGVAGSAEFGLQMTSGNSNTNNLSSGLHINQNLKNWRNHYAFESFYSDSDHVATTETYRGSLQSDYKYNNKEFWYVREEAEKDRFSGYKYKTNMSTGYGNRIWQQEDGSFLETSVGVGYRRNQLETGTEEAIFDRGVITRFALKYMKKLSASSAFRQSLTTQVNLEHLGTVTESISSLQANIVENFAMKLSYRVQYSSKAPLDTEKTDTETSITLLYSF